MSEKEFIRHISEFLTFCETEAPDDFKLDLLSKGLDPLKLAQKGDAFAKRLLSSRAQKERDGAILMSPTIAIPSKRRGRLWSLSGQKDIRLI